MHINFKNHSTYSSSKMLHQVIVWNSSNFYLSWITILLLVLFSSHLKPPSSHLRSPLFLWKTFQAAKTGLTQTALQNSVHRNKPGKMNYKNDPWLQEQSHLLNRRNQEGIFTQTQSRKLNRGIWGLPGAVFP